MLNLPVLVLNLNYEPINVCNVRRALLLIFKGKAEFLSNGKGQIHSVRQVFNLPSVIRLVHLVKRPFGKRKLSKKEVLLRDRHACQYCGVKSNNLTIDHVIPRFQSGELTWENIVKACIPCNHRKAGRTPEQAGMMLMKKPKPPYPSPYYVLYGRVILDEWRKFIFWTID